MTKIIMNRRAAIPGLVALVVVTLSGRCAMAAFAPTRHNIYIHTFAKRNIKARNVRDRPPSVFQPSPLAVNAAGFPLSSSTTIKATLVSFAFALLAKFRSRIFYPGTVPDSLHSEPLPKGIMGGCPWVGPVSIFSDINGYLSKQAKKVAEDQHGSVPTKIWKMFLICKPTAIISGSTHIKQVLSREFKTEGGGISQMTDLGNSGMISILIGSESMFYEKSDKKKYKMLQRIVGQSLTTESVAKGIPLLQMCAEDAVDEILAKDNVVMADILHKFTLDVAWRQIIGLKLNSAEEINAFHAAVKTWLGSLTNYLLLSMPIPMWLVRRIPPIKAKMYLNGKLEERIDELENTGPDGTTISGMIFAIDEEDGTTKLSRQQVIDNALLLLIAGSETSSLTLTNAMLLLGMYPRVWEKLVNEQQEFVQKHSDGIKKEDLDNDCPYLDSVIRETMRILPISLGGMRLVDDTIVINGLQIPKGWQTVYSPALTHEQDPKTRLDDGSHMDIRSGFKPERWMDPETRPRTEYMPFGAGYRFCLGHSLATAEMKIFLAILARNVHNFALITDTSKMKWKEGIILTPKDGVIVAAR